MIRLLHELITSPLSLLLPTAVAIQDMTLVRLPLSSKLVHNYGL